MQTIQFMCVKYDIANKSAMIKVANKTYFPTPVQGVWEEHESTS